VEARERSECGKGQGAKRRVQGDIRGLVILLVGMLLSTASLWPSFAPSLTYDLLHLLLHTLRLLFDLILVRLDELQPAMREENCKGVGTMG